MGEQEVKVWDPLVRVFHWVLVTGFFIAYLTEDDLMDLHVFAGYTVAGLLVVRLIWGFIGTPHARFTDFVRRPGVVITYLKDIVAGRAKRYIGHNPAGGAMIIALLVSLVMISITGVALYGADEHAGPMAGLFIGSPEWVEDALEEVHDFFANFTLLLVIVHVAGVVYEGIVHKENLVRAMVTGRKRA